MFRLLFLLPVVFTAATAVAQMDDFEQAPIRYSDSTPNDTIARLQAQLNAREVKIEGKDEKDSVHAILRALDVPESTQLLVFSKTSVQRVRISPQNPRAIYFSDDCYVGWVPGGMVEVAAIDPQLGPIFYTFDPLERGTSQPQRFRRDPSCLSCHAINFTRDIPGVFARSVFPEASGSPIFSAGSEVVDYTTPLADRWGGWYVTGRHGVLRHRGNAFAHERAREVTINTESGANLDRLDQFYDPSLHLQPTSDIGALLVFEHHLAMHQALTRANFESRRMLHYQHGLQESFKEPVTDTPSYDSVKSVFASQMQAVLDVLLYKDEAPMPDGGIRSAQDFVKTYEAGGRRTKDGRSLRDLDFKTRISRYRCSHLIYTEQFRQLPKPLLSQITTRLGRILTEPKPEERYAYLADDERKAIAEILRETAPELTASWAEKK